MRFEPGRWRKSSYSNAERECVEVAVSAGLVGVRDSKNSAGPTLVLRSESWAALRRMVRRG
ncbi:MAG: DUF397 domain-containing protein [Candidatus Limnocylindria bacterium]